jgi:predicted ATPase/DNA-binding CsgD family transcriptional regulator
MPRISVPHTPLIGRESDVARAVELVTRGSQRLVSLTGVGGSGKTRLAFAVIAASREAFPDGIAVVELARISNPAHVPEAVAASLGLAEATGDSLLETLQSTLGARRVLLVLDNCEHVIDACASLVDDLLSSCPELRVLATSREPMQIAGERQQRVPPLAAPKPGTSVPFEALMDYPAVRLFVERAIAVDGDFSLVPQNAGSVAAICGLLDGIPLAIELAAARISVLTPVQIQTRLDDCLRLLVGTSRSAPSRQQTIRATLDWSYDLLTPAEKMLLRRLSLFATGWSLDAAEGVCPSDGLEEEDVLPLLGRLVDKSLVVREELGGIVRCRMLEPVRQYAARRLAEHHEVESTRDRLEGYYIGLANASELELHGRGQARWLRILDGEFDNIRAVFHEALDQGRAEAGLKLAGPLYWYFWMRGHLREGQRWLETGLERSEHAAPEVRARAEMALAVTCSFLGDHAEGTAFGTAALAYYEEAGPTRDLVWTLVTLGYIAFAVGDLDRAQALAERAADLAEVVGVQAHPGQAILLKAQVARARGDAGTALPLVHEARAAFSEAGDDWGTASAERIIASFDDRSVDAWQEGALAAMSVYRDHGDLVALVGALEYFGGRMGEHQAETQVVLYAAARAARESLGAPTLVTEQADIDRHLTAARSTLGEARFAAAWSEGYSARLDDVVRSVLGETPPRDGRFASADGGRHLPDRVAGLTPREVEVATLLALGYTDQQIAEELVITRGTASLHVHHILGKLGLRSRFQVTDSPELKGLFETP